MKQISHDLNWHDLHLFLLLVELGSIRRAATAAGCSVNTLRTRIEALEETCGDHLLVRSTAGVRPTIKGARLLKTAERMRDLSYEAKGFLHHDNAEVTGEILVSATEGLGTFWLLPKFAELLKQNPALSVHLRCRMEAADIAKHEADISVQIEKPENSDLSIRRLGYMHFMGYASHDYLSRHGNPSSFPIEEHHRFVIQEAPQVLSRSDIPTPGLQIPDAKIALTVNTSTAQFYAVRDGVGIGALPTYAYLISNDIKPIDLNFHFSRDIWMVYNPRARHIKKIDQVADWLVATFDNQKHPYFAKEFIHPKDINFNGAHYC